MADRPIIFSAQTRRGYRILRVTKGRMGGSVLSRCQVPGRGMKSPPACAGGQSDAGAGLHALQWDKRQRSGNAHA